MQRHSPGPEKITACKTASGSCRKFSTKTPRIKGFIRGRDWMGQLAFLVLGNLPLSSDGRELSQHGKRGRLGDLDQCRRWWEGAWWHPIEVSVRSTMTDGQDGDRRSSRASSSTGSSSSFSPTISGFYGADAETAKHVVMLVNDVRQVGGDHVYKPFIRLLKDCAAGRCELCRLKSNNKHIYCCDAPSFRASMLVTSAGREKRH